MNRYLILSCFLLTFFNAISQIEFGAKLGIHSTELVSDGIKFDLNDRKLRLDYANSNYGTHFGLYSRVKLLGIYVEPSLLFNSTKTNYKLYDYTTTENLKDAFSETYYNLDIPVMVGFKASILRIFLGPVAHIHIANSSELTNISGYSAKFNSATYGFQTGIGVNLWKLRFDLSYEGNFSKFGNHINIGSNQFAFDSSPSRIIGTLGYKF